MSNIIQVITRQIGEQSVQAVNARDLHAFLEVGKDFSTWVKDRIDQYGFVEHQDYVTHLLPNFGEKGQGRPTKEYAISLDMAKELAMVERNDKGKEARRYFIECERRLKSAPAGKLPTQAEDAFRLMPSVVRAARCLGLDKNSAAISANQAVTKITGVNVLALLGTTHLTAEDQVLVFTPSELGQRLGGLSGRKVNMLLAEAGLQAKKGEHWMPLPPAEGFYRVLDTGKRHGDGVMIQQIKWSENVLSLLQTQGVDAGVV